MKNLRMLWNKYLIPERQVRFDTFKYEQEMGLFRFESLCTVPMPLTIMLRTKAYLILMKCCIQIEDTGLPSRQVLAFTSNKVSRPMSFTLPSLVA